MPDRLWLSEEIVPFLRNLVRNTELSSDVTTELVERASR